MDMLCARRPGNDGGKKTRRFERVGIPEQLAQLDTDSLKKLQKNLLALMVMKTRYPNKSESMVADELAFLACLYRQEGRYLLADACPKDYKTMLMVLESTNTVLWGEEVYYQQCPCGLVYRNCSRGDFSSATECPDCGTTRWDCLQCHKNICMQTNKINNMLHTVNCRKGKAHTLIYHPVTNFLKGSMGVPELAQQIGAWRSRISSDETMRVGTIVQCMLAYSS
jgi:hypothetical protein